MSTMVCMKEEEDPGEKLSQDEIISRTKQVIQGLEALKQEHHSILEGLLGTLRCLKQDEEGVLVEEKSHMIRKSLEMLELGLSEAQVHWSVIRSLVCTGDQTDGGSSSGCSCGFSFCSVTHLNLCRVLQVVS